MSENLCLLRFSQSSALPSAAERFREAWPSLHADDAVLTHDDGKETLDMPPFDSRSSTSREGHDRLPSAHERWQEAVNAGAPHAQNARGPNPPVERKQQHFPEGHRHVPLKRAELVNRDNIQFALDEGCGCKNKCLAWWRYETVLPFREEIAKRKELERNTYVCQLLDKYCHTRKSGYHGYRLPSKPNATAPLHSLCRAAILSILGICSGKLTHCIHLDQVGIAVEAHGNSASREPKLAVQCASWWAVYDKEFCETMSSADHYTPTSEPDAERYEEFKADQESLGWEVPSITLFLKVKAEKFAHIKSAPPNLLAHCDVCQKLSLRFKRAQTVDEKLAALEERREHHNLALREKQKAQEQYRLSNNHPSEIAYMLADYSTRFSLPLFRDSPQELHFGSCIRLQIFGTTTAANGAKTVWLHLPSFEKGPGAIGTFIWHEVVRMKTESNHPSECVAVAELLNRLGFRFPREAACSSARQRWWREQEPLAIRHCPLVYSAMLVRRGGAAHADSRPHSRRSRRCVWRLSHCSVPTRSAFTVRPSAMLTVAHCRVDFHTRRRCCCRSRPLQRHNTADAGGC